MTRKCPATTIVYEDNLVKRWTCKCHGTRSQGKRIREELKSEMFIGGNDIQRIYVEHGRIRALAAMRFAMDGSGLADVKRMFDEWAGHSVQRNLVTGTVKRFNDRRPPSAGRTGR